MIKMLSKHIGNLSIEDRVVLIRFIVGFIYGFAIFTSSYVVNPANLTPFAWATSIIIYYFTALYVSLKYRLRSKFVIYIRGLATFYGTWLLTAILLHEFSVMMGIKH